MTFLSAMLKDRWLIAAIRMGFDSVSVYAAFLLYSLFSVDLSVMPVHSEIFTRKPFCSHTRFTLQEST